MCWPILGMDLYWMIQDKKIYKMVSLMYNFSFQVRVCLKKSTPPYYLLRLVSPNKRKNLQKVYQLFSPISCLASLAPPPTLVSVSLPLKGKIIFLLQQVQFWLKNFSRSRSPTMTQISTCFRCYRVSREVANCPKCFLNVPIPASFIYFRSFHISIQMTSIQFENY